MMTACEVVVHHVFPTVRALIARELIETHSLTQKEAALRMGLTQPAISQYRKQLRGSRVENVRKNKEIMDKILEISNALANSEMTSQEATSHMCEICEFAKKGGVVDANVAYAACP